MNGEMLFYLVPFNIQGDSVRVRVDVGIDPYIKTVGASHSSCSSVSVRGGRLVAAPTGGGGAEGVDAWKFRFHFVPPKMHWGKQAFWATPH